MPTVADEPMRPIAGADWWKFTATGLFGVVATVTTGYLSGMSELVTRPQVREMIQTDSPYAHDRTLINERLDQTRLDTARLAGKFDAIIEGQTRMSGQLIQLSEQVSQLRDRDRDRPKASADPTK